MASILYLEDEENDAFLLERSLRRVGFDGFFHFVGDGNEAIAYMSGQPPYQDHSRFPAPTLLLCDLVLRQMSGLQFLDWLETQPQWRKIPVVIFSSLLWQEQLDKTRYPIHARITKPSGIRCWEAVARKVVALASQMELPTKLPHFLPTSQNTSQHYARMHYLEVPLPREPN